MRFTLGGSWGGWVGEECPGKKHLGGIVLGVEGRRFGPLKFVYMLNLLGEVFGGIIWRLWKCMKEQDIVLPCR